MFLTPFPHAADVVAIQRHSVQVAETPSYTRLVYTFSATFQGNDRPPLTAYGSSVEEAIASLYNALTVEFELALEGDVE